jgi:hypothetical protein
LRIGKKQFDVIVRRSAEEAVKFRAAEDDALHVRGDTRRTQYFDHAKHYRMANLVMFVSGHG